MRESSSLQDKMIDRNWVLKRKRKQISCRSDLSRKDVAPILLESPGNTSIRRKLNGDADVSRYACKLKGQDGYYFECVECDLGGNLLCCDSCPRTYHLQCLNPPLKRPPPGKWQCPHCCEQKDAKPLSNPETSSRRTNVRTSFENLKTAHKSLTSENVSLDGRSSGYENNASNNQQKGAFRRSTLSAEKRSHSSQVDASCSAKSSQSSDSGSMNDSLAQVDGEIKKNPYSPCDRKTSHNDNHCSAVELCDMTPKMNSDSCRNEMQRKKSIPSLVQSSVKSKKKQQKSRKRDKKKKKRCTTKKGEHVVALHCNRTSTETSGHENSWSLKKSKSTIQQISLSFKKEEVKTRKSSSQKQLEKFLDGAYPRPQQLYEHGVEVDKKAKCHESLLDETQQVDRILGCRLRATNVTSPCASQLVRPAPSPELGNSGSISENHASEQPSFGVSTSETLANTKDCINDTEGHEQCHSNIAWIDGRNSTSDISNMDGDCNLKTAHSTEFGEEAKVTNGSRLFSEDQHIGEKTCGNLEEGIANSMNADCEATKNLAEENTDTILDNCQEAEHHQLHLSCGSDDINYSVLEAQQNNSIERITLEKTVQDSKPTDKGTVTYEFLVKWMGKSNIHNSWISESQLKALAKRKLENYKAKYGAALINICEERWSVPQRVIALRVSEDGAKEALIKWCGLSYDECTWERVDIPVIEKSAHLIAEFNQFESQTLDKDAYDDYSPVKGDFRERVSLVEQPKELQGGSLFPHQLEALNWLRKCWHKSKNVILADEMGLGKTVSACAFISSLYLEFKAKLPCLVLVPLSTMPNWMAEFASWTPHLNVVEYHGSAKARSIIRQYEWHARDPDGSRKTNTSYKFNVLLTTYEMVLADSSQLRGIPWEVLIVDEGHRLKNSSSKLFSLLNSFSFQHRVLLTGTPLQNNIGEMYNLLNFLQPASFPSLSAFEEKFNDLTTTEKVEELKKLVAPHMLRRLKKDAMQNIPPKTERIVPVELSSIQAEYYRAMLTKNYQILRNTGKGGTQQSMLNIVMQLRKVCNHPYLIPGTEPESGSADFLHEMRIKASGKLNLLHMMLKILNKEGHRVLIFSQMTKLLDILEDYLTIEFGSKTFERVDGSVSVGDRQAAITRFNQDKSRFVFLLSTRSCGLGINLATADTVIIYDSDFNPHADIQAMNRAHRIGQSKRLLVYRLVVRASVEERILQLAKKKLMLDQLFVNKSESQKEVEDILRWGTEELFSECDEISGKETKEPSSSKVEVVPDGEVKHRRRSGGLGNVYKDKCTDGYSKQLWDENAILKLLDRTNLQSMVSESPDGDMENDMLGSVKSLEWNDEQNEEQGVPEVATGNVADGSDLAAEIKEEGLNNCTEENEWDRLLRVRWERYQIEEEAALGRGKRLRKAVSYKETFATIPSEALSESGNEDEEPVPEYTPAGRALKAKFAKLRARQKQRLAQRNMTEMHCSTEGPEVIAQPLGPLAKDVGSSDTSKLVDDRREQASPINLEERSLAASIDDKNESMSRFGKFSKHGYRKFLKHLDSSVRPTVALSPHTSLPRQQPRRQNYSNLVPASNHLPVLGLCAPNASVPRNLHSFVNQPTIYQEQKRPSRGSPDLSFPTAISAGSPKDGDMNDGEKTANMCPLPETSAEAFNGQMKNIIPDSYFPEYDTMMIHMQGPTTTFKGKGVDALDYSGSSFSAFQDVMALPKFVPDDRLPPNFSLPSMNVGRLANMDLLPSLSLGTNLHNINAPMQDLPHIPLVPNFRQQLSESLKQKQQVIDAPPMLGLGLMQTTPSSLPENHKKVLDNIMMRTGTARSKFLKKKLKLEAWSEDELDALWIGVRRHGRGSWDAMLRDPKLKFSRHRTCADLSSRWAEEQLKILDGPVFTAPRSSKPLPFPGISDGMMTRALLGSKFASLGTDPSKFRSHLTDIKLGFGDLTSAVPPADPSNQISTLNDSLPPLPACLSEKLGPKFPGDFSAGPSDRPEILNFPLDVPYEFAPLPNSNSFAPFTTNNIKSSDYREAADRLSANKYLKLPNFLDRPLNLVHDAHNNVQSNQSNKVVFSDFQKRQDTDSFPTNNAYVAGCSKTNKLPHWLRDAVSIAPIKPLEPLLPPTVSAIAQSVRLIYGEDKPTIPPFTIPGPPPFQPKDPRKLLKKKRKLHKLHQPTSEGFSPITSFDHASPSIIPPVPPFLAGTSSSPWADPNLNIPRSNLNIGSPSSSSLVTVQQKKSGVELSPPPGVLDLVASCVAPGACTSPAPDIASTSCQNPEVPVPNDCEISEPGGNGVIGDLKGIRRKRKASTNSFRRCWGKLMEEHLHQTESGESSKTHSDQDQADQVEVGEISSEKIVSSEQQSEHEQ